MSCSPSTIFFPSGRSFSALLLVVVFILSSLLLDYMDRLGWLMRRNNMRVTRKSKFEAQIKICCSIGDCAVEAGMAMSSGPYLDNLIKATEEESFLSEVKTGTS